MSADTIDPPLTRPKVDVALSASDLDVDVPAEATEITDPVAAACAALQVAVDQLLALELALAGSSDVVAALDMVEMQARRLPVARDALVAEVRTREIAAAHGERSTFAWLRSRYRLGAAEARMWLRGAERLIPRRSLTGEPLEALLPATAAARATGTLSAAQVKIIDDLDDELPTNLPVAARRHIEEAMVHRAQCADPLNLTRLGQHLLNLVDPDGEEPSEEEAHRRRGITIGPLRKGLARISGHVDAWTREAILGVLHPLAHPDPSGTATSGAPGGDATSAAANSAGATSADGTGAGGTTEGGARAGERTVAATSAGASSAGGTSEAPDWPTHDGFPEPAPGDMASGDAIDPGDPDPAVADSAGADPAGVDPAGVDPAGVDPAGVDPAGVAPAKSAGAGKDSGGQDLGGADPSEQPDPPPLDPDRRTGPQRLHDALRAAFERLLAEGSLPRRGGTPATILLTIPLATIEERKGHAVTAHGGDLPIREVIRRANDATFIPIVIDKVGNPLYLGRRQRLASQAQRLALHVRDRGCVIPGCTVPSEDCHAHHILDWADGGPTDITNLALLCAFHHHRIKPWTLQLKTGRIWCTPPPWVHRDQTPRVNDYFHPIDHDVLFTEMASKDDLYDHFRDASAARFPSE